MQGLFKRARRVFTDQSDITNSAGSEAVLGYKVYVALLRQSDTANPIATVLQNTLGFTPTWTRDAIGKYISNNANWIGLGGKVTVQLTKPGYGTTGFIGGSYTTEESYIDVRTNNVAGAPEDNILSDGDQFTKTTIEIRIYP